MMPSVQTADTNTKYKFLIIAAQQHVTTLVSPLHLFQAVQRLMSALNVAFATVAVVNTALPDARGAKQHIKFTAE